MSDSPPLGARPPAAAPGPAGPPAPATGPAAVPPARLLPVSPAEAALRAEHDALAEQVAVRHSVDATRRGLLLLFVGFLGVLLSGKLAWDRWGVLPPGVARTTPPGVPLYLYLAMAVTVVLMLLAIRAFLRSRRLAREEEIRFARLLELRAALGLDR